VLGTEPQIKAAFVKTGQLKLVFAPVLNHGYPSEQSHQAVECAAEQGKFWQFHDVLFEHQEKLWTSSDIQSDLKNLAAESGLNATAFNSCLDEQRYAALIQQQNEVRLRAGIRGQPVFDINGTIFFGGQTFETYQQTIEAAMPK